MSHEYDCEGNKVEKSAKTILEAVALYTLVTTTRYEFFKALLLRWIVADLSPHARATLRKWIMVEYLSQKEALKCAN